MYVKRLYKSGNSNVFVLDKVIMKMIGATEGCKVKLTIENGKLVVEPLKKAPL